MMWRNWFVSMWRSRFVSSGVRLDVARGVALLDADRPGWRHLVDVKQLDMWDYKRCVLGQVYGDYLSGVRELGLHAFFADTDNGFYPYRGEGRVLARQWRRVIRRGRWG